MTFRCRRQILLFCPACCTSLPLTPAPHLSASYYVHIACSAIAYRRTTAHQFHRAAVLPPPYTFRYLTRLPASSMPAALFSTYAGVRYPASVTFCYQLPSRQAP